MFSALNLKIGGAILAGVALIALLWSWSDRGRRIETLTQWQTTVVKVTTDATVEPDKDGKRKLLKPDQVAGAISGLKRSLDSSLGALRQIDTETKATKDRADAADKRLADELARFEQQRQAASATIAKLQARKPAATPAEANTAIEEDSRAAWENWR